MAQPGTRITIKADEGRLVEAEVAARDRQDMNRALAPLIKPEGAVVVDSTTLPLDEVVEMMARVVEQAWCCTRS